MPQPDGHGMSKSAADLRYDHSPSLDSALRIAWLGDSITLSQTASTSANYPTENGGFPAIASFFCGFRFVGNFGVPGNTLSQLLNRVDDVLAVNPDVVHILGGTNDAGSAVMSLEQSIATFKQILDKFHKVGVRVIVGALPPRANDSNLGVDGLTYVQRTMRLRLMEREVCRQRGILWVDYYRALAAPTAMTQEGWGSSKNGDPSNPLVHPSRFGDWAMALALLEALKIAAPKNNEWSPWNQADDFRCIIANGYGSMRDGGVVDGIAEGWTVGTNSVSGAGVAYSFTSDPDGQAWWKVSLPSGATGAWQAACVGTTPGAASPRGYSVGDRILAIAKIRGTNNMGTTPGPTNGWLWRVRVRTSASSYTGTCSDSRVSGEGIAFWEFVVPPGSDRMDYYLTIESIGTPSNDSSLEFGGLALYNLTRLGYPPD